MATTQNIYNISWLTILTWRSTHYRYKHNISFSKKSCSSFKKLHVCPSSMHDISSPYKYYFSCPKKNNSCHRNYISCCKNHNSSSKNYFSSVGTKNPKLAILLTIPTFLWEESVFGFVNRKEWKKWKNQHCLERGNVSRALKNRFYCQVSRHFFHPL